MKHITLCLDDKKVSGLLVQNFLIDYCNNNIENRSKFVREIIEFYEKNAYYKESLSGSDYIRTAINFYFNLALNPILKVSRKQDNEIILNDNEILIDGKIIKIKGVA